MDEFVVCHSCWEEDSKELQDLKRGYKKRKKQLKEIEVTGEKIAEELMDVRSVEQVRSLLQDYQQNLNLSMEMDAERDIFLKILDDACEPLSNKLFDAAKEEGWSFLLELIDKHPPFDTPDSMPIVNAVSRYVIWIRFKKEVEDIPIEALEYLTEFNDEPTDMWEDSFTCGWGFDHPEFDFVGELESAIEKGQIFWAVGALEQVFYFEQEKGADILIDFLRREDLTEDEKYDLTQSIALIGDKEWESSEFVPHYWDWKEAVGYDGFEWDKEVKSTLREAIEEELEERVSEMVGEWDFCDLASR